MELHYGSFDATPKYPHLTRDDWKSLLVGIGFVIIMFGAGIILGGRL